MAEITGVVSSVSQTGTGIQIDGKWFNYSRNNIISNKPIRGQRVTLDYDPKPDGSPGGWINSLEILDDGAVQQRPAGGGSRSRMTNEERREIRRMNILRTASDFAGRLSMTREGISSADVLKIADAWLAWLEKK
jgi:hypothetical protein